MNTLQIQANTIDNTHFTYTCPLCWSKYNKNGDGSKRGKPVTHRHGSDTNLCNRIEHRVGHGDKCRNYTIEIHITDETLRLN